MTIGCNTVLFLCTGNYYRSRFAEMYLNDLAGRAGIDWSADSRALNISAAAPRVAERLSRK
jgi:protein-tyrosine phosphatase